MYLQDVSNLETESQLLTVPNTSYTCVIVWCLLHKTIAFEILNHLKTDKLYRYERYMFIAKLQMRKVL